MATLVACWRTADRPRRTVPGRFDEVCGARYSCATIAGMTDQPPPQNNRILTRFRAALAEVYGDRVERVVLYGSRARRSPPGFRL